MKKTTRILGVVFIIISMLSFKAVETTIGFPTVIAQSVSDKIIGKWQLQTMTEDGNTLTAKEAMNTSDVYQVYDANGTFTSIVGNEKNSGTWKISKNNKKIVVNNQGLKANFKIKSIGDDTMVLEMNIGVTSILTYKKVQ